MKLARIPLLEALNTIKPALATKDIIEEMMYAWFDGKRVMAYNDAELGIQVPCPTPFTGGVRGALLSGLLMNARAKEVTFEAIDDGSMLVKVGQASATLVMHPVSRMASIWKFPEPNMKRAFKLGEDFATALKQVMISVGKDLSVPDTIGVTFIGDDGMSLYATDSNTIATMQIDAPKGFKRGQRMILPTAFCEQLLKLVARGGGFMEVCDDCAIAGNEDGAMVYARLVDSPKPSPLDRHVSRYDKYPKMARFEIPDKLALALDRMAVLFEGLAGETMSMKLGGGEMRLLANIKGRGELKDSLEIPDDVPEVSLRVDPLLVKRAIGIASHMVCTDEAVRMSGKGGFVYLVSTSVVPA